MHDGSLPDIASVLRFYNAGGVPHPGLDPRVRPLELNDAQLHDLEEFLRSLTGDNVTELAREARSQAIGDPGATDEGMDVFGKDSR
jgi:cytochrome c peroxidase